MNSVVGKANESLTKNQRKKLQKKRKANDKIKMAEINKTEKQKAQDEIELVSLQKEVNYFGTKIYDQSFSSNDLERATELVQQINANSAYLASQRRLVEQQASFKKAAQEKEESLEALDNLAELMLTAAKISGEVEDKEDVVEALNIKKATGKFPNGFLEGFQEGLQQCVYEEFLDSWRPSVVLQKEKLEEEAKKQYETNIINKVFNHETEIIEQFHSSENENVVNNGQEASREMIEAGKEARLLNTKSQTACNSAACPEAGESLCSGCCSVSYCSESCSKEAWRGHRRECRREARRRREREATSEVD